MAIETTYFSNTTDNPQNVYAYLQTNAIEYFDEIELTTDDSYIYINCKIGEINFVQLRWNTTTGKAFMFSVTLANGKTSSSTVYTDIFVRRIIKNENWFAIAQGGDDGESLAPAFIITRNTLGETMVIFNARIDSSTNDWLEATSANSVTIDKCFNNDQCYSADVTTLTPIACVASGGYCEYAFAMLYTQHKNKEGIIEINGNKYYTNGYVALTE